MRFDRPTISYMYESDVGPSFVSGEKFVTLFTDSHAPSCYYLTQNTVIFVACGRAVP
jgi:hypothetical protein